MGVVDADGAVRPPLAKQVGERIGRPGRKLEPHDLGITGPVARAVSEPEPDVQTARRYPTSQAFEADMSRIWRSWVCARQGGSSWWSTSADPRAGACAGGSGAATSTAGRTRVQALGMNTRYNIRCTELGTTWSRCPSWVDHTPLSGWPNNASTEALGSVSGVGPGTLAGEAGCGSGEWRRCCNDFYRRGR